MKVVFVLMMFSGFRPFIGYPEFIGDTYELAEKACTNAGNKAVLAARNVSMGSFNYVCVPKDGANIK